MTLVYRAKDQGRRARVTLDPSHPHAGGYPTIPMFAVYEDSPDGRYLGDVRRFRTVWRAMRAGESEWIGGIVPWIFPSRAAAAQALATNGSGDGD